MSLKNLLLIVNCSLLLSCAQFVAPTGGKKDENPPKLLKSMPENKKISFQGKEIDLIFDEWISTQSLRQELLITPEIEGTYDIKPKSDGVKLVFDKPFKENTTYTLNFRNGIKDLNESNEAKNLKLVFSTGTKIDSLFVKGKIKDLFTNQEMNEILVGLYELTDSLNFKKHKPSYFVKTDSSGIFNFENLRSATYKLLAFNDKNNNLIYDAKNEEVSFLKDSISLSKSVENINLSLYKIDNRPPKISKKQERSTEYNILLDEGIKDFKLKFLSQDSLANYLSGDKTIKILNSKKDNKDSVLVWLMVRDSVDNMLNDTLKFKFREPEKKKYVPKIFGLNTSIDKGGEIKPNLEFDINFENPIEKAELNNIKLVSDSTQAEKIAPNEISWNEYKTKLHIHKKLNTKSFLLVDIPKGTFIDFQGDTSAILQEKFYIMQAENYGSIEGQIGKYNGNILIDLIDENYKTIIPESLESPKTKYIFKNVKEGTYFVRIIEDKNKNGRWDAGSIDKWEQPERINVYETEIPVKANFELKNVDISFK
jgi:Bacterial Ig-like domain